MYHEPHADSAHVVYQIKYFDKPDTGVDIGTLMGKAMKDSDFLNDIDALLPVPLAKTRERERGFNQSEMIALGIRDATGLPILDDVVKRNNIQWQSDAQGPHQSSRERRACVQSCERRQLKASTCSSSTMW
jgi:predicted amidophosphoribosyltransferase